MAGAMPEVLVLGPPDLFLTSDYEKRFSDRFRVLKPWESPLPLDQFLQTHAGNTRAMLCSGGLKHLGVAILSHLPALRLVVVASVGVSFIDFPECRRRGVAVANAGTIFSTDVADLAVGLVMDVLRRISAGDGFVKSGKWVADSGTGTYRVAVKVNF